MDFRQIKKLIEFLQASGIAEIEIGEGKDSIRIRTGRKEDIKPESKQPTPALDVNVAKTEPAVPKATTNTPPAGVQNFIHAPMVGKVYLSKTPEDKPVVKMGQTIKMGDVVCFIQAMKILNPIPADKDGKIAEILVENGGTVGYNQPIFRLEKG